MAVSSAGKGVKRELEGDDAAKKQAKDAALRHCKHDVFGERAQACNAPHTTHRPHTGTTFKAGVIKGGMATATACTRRALSRGTRNRSKTRARSRARAYEMGVATAWRTSVLHKRVVAPSILLSLLQREMMPT